MLIAALLVPATTWWAGLRCYRAQKNAESALVVEKNAQQQPDAAKPRREAPPIRLDSNSVEFTQMPVLRTSWNGQTDPDSVWHDQHHRANLMLVKHGLPALDVSRPVPDSPAQPKTLRIGDEK
ncbi:hypothetical protein [Prosthecobacter sp.]|uniref:hypothetical protein n=1 Tax=Prosthecobacter sp. TaxID=1965333 RepID=UPI003784C24D